MIRLDSRSRLCSGVAIKKNKKTFVFPFVQFIELPEVSRPARPQMWPVKPEMERKLSGPYLPHHCRKDCRQSR